MYFGLCQECGRELAEYQSIRPTEGDRSEVRLLCPACATQEDEVVIDNPDTASASTGALAEVIADSQLLAGVAAEPAADTKHLLGAMLRAPAGVRALGAYDLDGAAIEALRTELGPIVRLDATDGEPVDVLTRAANAAVVAAQARAQREVADDVTLEHLVHGIVATDNGIAARMLRNAGVQLRQLTRPPPELPFRPPTPSARQTPALDQFSRDLSTAEIDPIIGREKEIGELIEILCRRRKNNPVLVGPPGVGKTAIVDGLALRIKDGRVPEELSQARIVALDLGGLVAGCSVRGEFEMRLKAVIEEATTGGDILFIDELPSISGLGAGSGAMDGAQLLKPLLMRGDLRVIGATTPKEYKTIERDGGLERRFSPVRVEPPSVEDTIAILRGVREKYEQHHRVQLADDALVAAARLAERYISERELPDKAIDLIDQAASRIRIAAPRSPENEETETEQALSKTASEREQAIAAEDFTLVTTLTKRLSDLGERLTRLRDHTAGEPTVPVVEVLDVCAVLEARTGIAAGELAAGELERLRGLESELHQRVIGQAQAVNVVCDAIRGARLGLSDPDKPLGTFLFLGPTGVGKTELAKGLAERLFGSDDVLVRIDMSEYAEHHSAARLIGSPPGYIGYGDGGQLTEPVRRRPYSVVLLDEIEKAHPKVVLTLLQLLDDGRLTDGEGRTVDFRHAVVIMTSNVGSASSRRPVGFTSSDADPAHHLAELRKTFRAEFLNRIDEKVVFEPLVTEQITEICRLQCTQLAQRLQDAQGITLNVSQELYGRLAEDGFSTEFGARELRRHIHRALEVPITNGIVEGRIRVGQPLRAECDANGTLGLISPAVSTEPAATDLATVGAAATENRV
jgi:ATP-dependent Clp protease ATP-binding subunit ClpC